jgi:hypothetical protein
MIIREQEAASVSYLCGVHGHTSVNCPRLKIRVPQIKVELMGDWNQSTVNTRNLPRLYKTRRGPVLDPGAAMNQ